ncbi:unnamed protein product [Moneuplotes crassus]|uniref:Uncharacterized protein n=1 Tax=Euplotes crassus TaxID=5936 RepID=A0AAD1Y3E1_EUPCR|nr:unnamed protein product [Moneuplotes crassus]
MNTQGHQKSLLTYLSPTESSARKNIHVEPMLDETSFSSTIMAYEATPTKRTITSERVKKVRSSERTESSKYVVNKSTSYNKSPVKVTHTRGRSRGGVIEKTKVTTTTYSPDAKNTSIIRSKCSHRRKNCCSAKKMVKTAPSKVVKTRSTSYEFTDPNRIPVDFDDSQKVKIKKKNYTKGKQQKLEGISRSLKRADELRFDVDNSDINSYLSTLICNRIDEGNEIGDKRNFMPSTEVPDLERHITDLKKELNQKRRILDKFKWTSKNKNESFKKVKKEMNSGPDHMQQINSKKEQDLKQYISHLKEIKLSLEKLEPKSSSSGIDYLKNFDERHAKCVELLDKNGIEHNEKLTELLAKSEAKEQKIDDLEEAIDSKARKRLEIINDQRVMDKRVLDTTESSSQEIHKLLQLLGKLILQKGDLQIAIAENDSDIVNSKINLSNLKASQGKDISKTKGKPLAEKVKILRYINTNLTKSQNSYERILSLLNKTRSDLPRINYSNGRKAFNADLEDLRTELKKYKDLEMYLKKSKRDSEYGAQKEIDECNRLLQQRKRNSEKLTEILSNIIKINIEIAQKEKQVKELEGKLLLANFGDLEKYKQDLERILAELQHKLESLSQRQGKNHDDLIIQIEQKDRIIVRLVNQLRNLDDKILYVKNNKPKSREKKNVHEQTLSEEKETRIKPINSCHLRTKRVKESDLISKSTSNFMKYSRNMPASLKNSPNAYQRNYTHERTFTHVASDLRGDSPLRRVARVHYSSGKNEDQDYNYRQLKEIFSERKAKQEERSRENGSFIRNPYRCQYHLEHSNDMNSTYSQSYNRYEYTHTVSSGSYKVFVPSDEELKNLIPESIFSRVKKTGYSDYEIDRYPFTFLRDQKGDTYAQNNKGIYPLHKFLERFKQKTENGVHTYSPAHTHRAHLRHAYHSLV